MIKMIEASAKTTEEAIRKARAELGIGPDDGAVEVLTLPKSGFLGIGAVQARVRVSYDDGIEAPAPAPAEKPMAPRPPRKGPVKKEAAPKAAPAEPVTYAPGSREERVRAFLAGLMEHMEVECSIQISEREGGGLDVRLDGPNMGAVIGRRGETLDAIQHLVNYAINRGSDKHMHINVDAEDYRSKREESLVHLAEKMAAKAIKYKRSMALEPMNSYERHVIHTALQNYEGVSTSSTGTEPNRRVVVNYERAPGEAAEEPRRSHSRPDRSRSGRPAPKKTEPREEKAAEPAPSAPPAEKDASVPADYTPPVKNKPQSREWC